MPIINGVRRIWGMTSDEVNASQVNVFILGVGGICWKERNYHRCRLINGLERIGL